MIVECPACNTIFPVDPKKVPTGGVDARCSVCSEVFFVAPPEPDTEVLEPDVEGIETKVEVPEPYIDGPTLEAETEVATDGSFETESEAAFEIETEPSFEERGVAFGTGVEPVLEEDPAPETTFEPEPVFESAETTFETMEETAAAPTEEFQGDSAGVGEALSVDMDTATTEVVEEVTGSVEETPEGPTISAPVFGKRDPMEKAQRLARVLVSDIILYNPDRHHTATETGRVREEFEEEIQKSWSEYVEQVGDEVANTTPYFNDALNEILAKGEKIF